MGVLRYSPLQQEANPLLQIMWIMKYEFQNSYTLLWVIKSVEYWLQTYFLLHFHNVDF